MSSVLTMTCGIIVIIQNSVQTVWNSATVCHLALRVVALVVVRASSGEFEQPNVTIGIEEDMGSIMLPLLVC